MGKRSASLTRVLGVLAFVFGVLQASTARAERDPYPPRLVEYGVLVAGKFAPGDKPIVDRGYLDLYRFHGKAGDRVLATVASRGASPFVRISYAGALASDTVGSQILEETTAYGVNKDNPDTWGRSETAVLVYSLPNDGWYDVWVVGQTKGFVSSDSNQAIAYAVKIDRKPSVTEVEFQGLHGGRRAHFHAEAGAAIGLLSHDDYHGVGAANLVLAYGYQGSPGFGLDLLTSTTIAQKPLNDGEDRFLLLTVLVGPRIRTGTKQRGFFSVTPAVSYLSMLSGTADTAGLESGAGLGLRLESAVAVGRDASPMSTVNVLFFVEGHRYGETSLYYMGAAVAF